MCLARLCLIIKLFGIKGGPEYNIFKQGLRGIIRGIIGGI
jgi:hypothetical protein